MRKTDRQLGMHRAITRRDFIHDVSLGAAALGLPWPAIAGYGVDPGLTGAYYPPTRTGIRGSHPGSFEVAHTLGRQGARFPASEPLDETYDLVVVGGGISGLAAAYYYRKLNGPGSRILVLDNHDDFGGHAKRNEFRPDGYMRLATGGTVNLEYPKYSDVAMGLVRELGVDIPRLKAGSGNFWEDNADGLKHGTWFDAEHFGADVFVPDVRMAYLEPAKLAAALDDFPISSQARDAWRRFLLFEGDVLAGKDVAAKTAYLRSTSYTDFLVEHFDMPREVLDLLATSTMGYWGVPADNLSVAECMDSGLQATHALGGFKVQFDEGEGGSQGSAMFPDGNSSIARLLVRSLVPAAVPDMAADADPFEIVTSRMVYEALDLPESPVRLRLNSTVVRVENTEEGVSVTYARSPRLLRVNARQCVLACYNEMIPHICPALPESQKQALAQCIKRPMLIINVLLRNGEAISRSGIAGAVMPARLCQSMNLMTGVNAGDYRPRWRPEDPCVVQFYAGVMAPEPDGLSITGRNLAGRARLLGMSFEDYEREVRTVLNGIYGPSEFDAATDITAIMVNRWPHGYARDHLDLEDPAWNADPPPNVVGRAKFGNITIANSDAGADAFTHTAIDQAWRAVNELLADA